MLKKLNLTVKNLDGEPITDPSSPKPVTFASVCVNALLFQEQSSNLSGDQKVTRFALAQRIHAAKGEDETVDMSAEEVSLIKEVANKLYAPLIYGRLVEALDPKEK